MSLRFSASQLQVLEILKELDIFQSEIVDVCIVRYIGNNLKAGCLYTPPRHDVKCCCLSKCNQFIISASWYDIIIWDAESGKMIRTFPHSEYSRYAYDISCCVSNDSRFIVSMINTALRVWDFSTGKMLYALPLQHGHDMTSCCISNDSQFIVSADSVFDTISTLKIWSAKTGTLLKTLTHSIKNGQDIECCCISKDDQFLVSCGYDCRKIWNFETGDLLWEDDQSATFCRFSNDNELIVFADFTYLLVSTFKKGSLQLLRKIDPCSNYFEQHIIQSFCISDDNRFIASVPGYAGIEFWDLKTGELFHTLSLRKTGKSSCHIFNDNRFVLTSCEDRTLKIWDMLPFLENSDHSKEGHTDVSDNAKPYEQDSKCGCILL